MEKKHHSESVIVGKILTMGEKVANIILELKKYIWHLWIDSMYFKSIEDNLQIKILVVILLVLWFWKVKCNHPYWDQCFMLQILFCFVSYLDAFYLYYFRNSKWMSWLITLESELSVIYYSIFLWFIAFQTLPFEYFYSFLVLLVKTYFYVKYLCQWGHWKTELSVLSRQIY